MIVWWPHSSSYIDAERSRYASQSSSRATHDRLAPKSAFGSQPDQDRSLAASGSPAFRYFDTSPPIFSWWAIP